MPVDMSMIGLQGERHFNEMRQLEANTRSTIASAKSTELANEEAERTAEVEAAALARLGDIAKGGKGTDGSAIITASATDSSKGAPLEELGRLMIEGGAVKRGQEYLKAGVEIRSKENDILNDIETRKKTRLDNIVKVGELFSRTFGTAKNESEWNFAIDQMEKDPSIIEIFGPENFEALKASGYDPNVAEFLNQRAIDAAERARLELQQQGNDRAERNAIDLANYRQATIEISRANLAARNREFAARQKTDGTKASIAPTEQDLKSARTAIANLIFDGKVPNKDDPQYVAFEAGAQDIASQARAMVQENKALDFNQAITRVTLQSKADGDWLAGPGVDNRFGITKALGLNEPAPVENAKYRGRGMKAVDAVAMPESRDALKAGMYYITPRGVAKWDGEKFIKDN